MNAQVELQSTIVVSSLNKSFSEMAVLKDIDFALDAGGFLTVFGPNGAGKTTLIRILAILTKPTSGTVSVGGFDVSEHRNKVRGITGVISHDPYLYPDLTAFENIRFFARMYGVTHAEDRAAEVIAQVGLRHRMYDVVRSFSRGMQQRLAVARAVVNDPEVLLLDEPYTGLDQHGAEIFTELLRGLKDNGRTVVMTTHNIDEGLGLSDRVMIINGGRVVYDDEKKGVEAGEFREIYLSKVGAA